MMRALLVALLGISLVACGGGDGDGGGNVLGGTDNNDSFNTADPIDDSANGSVQGELEGGTPTGPDPEDYFRFTAPTAGNYDFTLTWDDPAFDLDLELYNLVVDPDFPIRFGSGTNGMEKVNDLVLFGGDIIHIRVLATNSPDETQSYVLTIE